MEGIEEIIEATLQASHPDIQLIYLNNLIDRIVLEIAVQEELIENHYSYNVDDILEIKDFPEGYKQTYRTIESSIIRGHSLSLIKSFPDTEEKRRILKETEDLRKNLRPVINEGIQFYKDALT